MTLLTRKNRTAIAAAAIAAVVPFATAAPVGAAPVRTADTTKYTSALYLQSALGLPTSEADPAIESVTYDRFQWILGQAGQYAILIGDPATDPTFKQRAQDVEQAADAAGVKDVYWFNPNLSGNAQIGSITEPNLDIRNKGGIQLSAASQNKVANPWFNLVGNYLGNGVDAKATGGTWGFTTKVAAKSNDYGSTAGHSTKVGDANGGALYDYTSTDQPADIQESRFVIYDRDRTVLGDKVSKVAAWIDLTDAPSSASTKADVATAFASIGGGDDIDAQSEFNWWRSANNEKQAAASSTEFHGKNDPVLTDDDNDAADGGWRVHQVTYPELVFLLKSENSKDAVLLLGGTWCPNTRPVIQAINRNAQENDVTVFNFDTILDGGTTGGNSSANPLQSRNTAGTNANATTGLDSNPSWLYADLVKQYLGNIKTEYDPATNSTVTYFPGGDTTKPIARINRLQVPFVVSFKGKNGDDTPDNGATRQWIIDDGDGTYTEYMSQYWFTRPREGQLGLSSIPKAAPIWAKINADLKAFTWQSDPTANYVNTGTDADDADFLGTEDKAKVVYDAKTGWTISASTNPADNPIAIDPATLKAAQTALGAQAPATLAAAKTAWIAADAATPQDPVLLANLKTVVGAFGVAQSRKNTINNTWGAANKPGSIAGGIAAVRALDVFFGGLPGGVVSKRKVKADNVVAGNAVPISIDITNEFGRTPAGNVTLVVKQGGTQVATQAVAVSGGKASFSVADLAAGSYDFTLSYATDAQLLGFSESGSFTVSAAQAQGDQGQNPAPGGSTAKPSQSGTTTPPAAVKPVAAIKLAGAVSKAPTSKRPGKYQVKVTPAAGRAAGTGKVTLTLKKGKTKKTLTGTLKNGVLTVNVPKLAKGTWKVTISWVGDANHLAIRTSGASIKVKK